MLFRSVTEFACALPISVLLEHRQRPAGVLLVEPDQVLYRDICQQQFMVQDEARLTRLKAALNLIR